VSKAQAVLGFHARTSLADGIGKLMDHLRTRGDSAAMLGQVREVNWGTDGLPAVGLPGVCEEAPA
jgi:hypothetical protein